MAKFPGKIIISGEHAVVYGKLALATSIGLGVEVKVANSQNVTEINPVVTKAIEVAGGGNDVEIVIKSELPVGSGLGSSAAVAAAVITAIKENLGKTINKDELFELTMECEKIAHGNPSGVDPAAVIYGGLIAFKKGQPFQRISLPKEIRMLLVDSGKPEETTKEMVSCVAESNNNKVINRIGEITEKIKTELIEGLIPLSELDENGILLEELGVVGSKAKLISNELRAKGYVVKATGAGGIRSGSGILLVLGNEFAQAKSLLDNKKIPYWETSIGGK